MQSHRLQDRIYYGQGVAARRVGGSADAFRPDGPSHPLAKRNRFLRLPVIFLPLDGGTRRPVGYGNALWQGLFDAAYTRPGDYLTQMSKTYFIAAQQCQLPVLCIQANRSITVSRPSLQTNAAENPYGGYKAQGSDLLLDDWPASVLGINGKGEAAAGLPTDQTTPALAILMPYVPGMNLSFGDLITDDLGRNAVITATELTDLGWRLNAKLSTT